MARRAGTVPRPNLDLTVSAPPRSSRRNTTHLVLEALQYVLLALVSVLAAVVVISAFIRIVQSPGPEDRITPTSTTVPVADSIEVFGGSSLSVSG